MHMYMAKYIQWRFLLDNADNTNYSIPCKQPSRNKKICFSRVVVFLVSRDVAHLHSFSSNISADTVLFCLNQDYPTRYEEVTFPGEFAYQKEERLSSWGSFDKRSLSFLKEQSLNCASFSYIVKNKDMRNRYILTTKNNYKINRQGTLGSMLEKLKKKESHKSLNLILSP